MAPEPALTPDLVITNASEIVPVTDAGESPVIGPTNTLKTIAQGAIAIANGDIVALGPSREVLARIAPGTQPLFVDAGGRSVIPGFVDAHAHPVYIGNRDGEYLQRLEGRSYLEISRAGGGIHETVRKSSLASRDVLKSELLDRMARFTARGTTTAEAKTGYWLATDGERRALEAIKLASSEGFVDLVPTFLGANTIPPGEDPDDYVRTVIAEMIPAVAEVASFCDVVCDIGHFTTAQSRLILEAASDHGMGLKIHADEFADVGAAALAAEMQSTSADHLCYSSDQALNALSAAGTVGVLLPTTKLFRLAPQFANARSLIERGVPVALGTDHGPSNPIASMPYVIMTTVHHLGLTPAEALVAATWNAAIATGTSGRAGKLAVGRPADIVILDMASYRFLPYFVDRAPVWQVLKRGVVVMDRTDGASSLDRR